MSEFRIDQIKNQGATRGPNVAGITTFTGTSGIVMPSGTTNERGITGDFITNGLVLYVDVSLRESYNPSIPTKIFDGVTGTVLCSEFSGSPTFSAADSTGPDRLVFDGSSDGILFDRNDQLMNFGTGDPLTVSIWVKIDESEDGTASPFSIQRCNNPGIQIWIDTGSGAANAIAGRIVWRVGSGDQHVVDTRLNLGQTANGKIKSGGFAPRVDGRGKWVNITGTYQGRFAELYINGKRSDFNEDVVGTFNTITNAVNGSGIGIMRRWPCGNSAFTKGEFNHCAMYRRKLSSSEILQNYNVLKGRFK